MEVSSKLKVALLHYTSPPIVGGVETVMAAHARELAACGYEVTIIAGRRPVSDEAQINLETVIEPLIDSKNERINAINQALDKGEVPADFVQLENEIFERLQTLLTNFSACIVHNVFTLHKNLALTVALARLAQTLPVKFIAWTHDLAWTNPLYQPVLYERYPWTLLKTANTKVTYVAISPQRQQEILTTLEPGLHAKEVPIVPNGVAVEDFLGIGTVTRQLIKTAGLDEARRTGAWLLLLPSRITRRKNIELAIATVAALKQEGRNVRLIVTGPPGPHNPKNDVYVRELVALRQHLGVVAEVIFLMEKWQDAAGIPLDVSDATMAELYRYCDAMLMPSSQEGFGIPLLEAGLTRLPIFCTNLEPFHELADEEATFFEPDANPNQVAQIITNRLNSDPAFRLRQRILTQYTWNSIFRQKIEPLVKN